MTIFVLLFDVYFLLRSLSYGEMLLRGYYKLSANLKTNWLDKLEALDQLSEADRSELNLPDWRQLYHAVILPTYKEPLPILERAFDSVLASDYPLDKFILVLATEGRDHQTAHANSLAIMEKYKDKFAGLLIT
ncbi:MAG: hypothetical protein WCG94_06870, partial [Methanothrix sp.]